MGNLTIQDIEENFLSELVDYANETISRDVQLKVPAKNNPISWPGLQPNAK